MTDKQFWMKLDQLLSPKYDRVLRSYKAVQLIRQAAKAGLSLIVAGEKGNPITLPHPDKKHEKWYLYECYSSRQKAQADRMNRGVWSTIPASQILSVIDSDPNCQGIFFNGYSHDVAFFVTREGFDMDDEMLKKNIYYDEHKDEIEKEISDIGNLFEKIDVAGLEAPNSVLVDINRRIDAINEIMPIAPGEARND